MNKINQLEILVGKQNWFGQESRIIITTKDRHLLESYKNNILYEAKGLNKDEALQLCSQNAFLKPYCQNDFSELCNNFVNFAQGLPLALKVLGSHLFTITKKERESAWNQLRAKPREKAIEKLRIAYDGLGKIEKSQILDIECFLKGEGKNQVADILDMLESVGYSHTNKRNLIDNCLSTIEGEKLSMYDLLQQMGSDIIGEELEEPERHSRLWRHDVLKVIKNIAWHDFPLKLPNNFLPQELVELTIRHGKIGKSGQVQVGSIGSHVKMGRGSKRVIFKRVNRVAGQTGHRLSRIELTRIFHFFF